MLFRQGKKSFKVALTDRRFESMPTTYRLSEHNNILASIVVSTRNCAAVLRNTLIGISFQSVPSCFFEVIVVDDGSKDEIKALLGDFYRLLNIRFIKLVNGFDNIRLAATRNKGISRARGRIILTLDADCIPTRHWLLAHLISYNKPGIACFGPRKFVYTKNWRFESIASICYDYTEISHYPSISNHFKTVDPRIRMLSGNVDRRYLYSYFYFCNSSFYESDALRCGLIDEEFDGNWGYEDIEFAYRLMNSGVELRFLPQALVLHQENYLHTLEDRRQGREINLRLVCSKIPGHHAYHKPKTILHCWS